MDSKNVILAVVFSTIVLVFWGTFFAPPEMEREIQNNTTNQIEEGSSPSIEDARALASARMVFASSLAALMAALASASAEADMSFASCSSVIYSPPALPPRKFLGDSQYCS